MAFFSAEWLLTGTKRPNGGDIVFARAVWVAFWVYLLAFLLQHDIDTTRTRELTIQAIGKDLRNTVPWFGAIFAAAYVALYTRFSSQWLYLANLYNHIFEAEARTAGEPSGQAAPVLAQWKAGFIEDAEELHLSTKGLFVSVVRRWALDKTVQGYFINNAPGGEKRLNILIGAVNNAFYLHHISMAKRCRGAEKMLTDETAHFRSATKAFGFDENEFELIITSPSAGASPADMPAATVTVRRRSTGVQKTYPALGGSYWPALFHNDLALGAFGTA